MPTGSSQLWAGLPPLADEAITARFAPAKVVRWPHRLEGLIGCGSARAARVAALAGNQRSFVDLGEELLDGHRRVRGAG
jgi:hypothetical protein